MCKHCLAFISQILTVRSELPDAKRELSEETETLKTQEPCPETVPASCACCLLKIRLIIKLISTSYNMTSSSTLTRRKFLFVRHPMQSIATGNFEKR